jgi:hypothetical protein
MAGGQATLNPLGAGPEASVLAPRPPPPSLFSVNGKEDAISSLAASPFRSLSFQIDEVRFE